MFTQYNNFWKMKNDDNGFELSVAAPGINKEKVDITITGNDLTISIPESDFMHEITRTFVFEYGLSEKQVKAKYEDNGVLKVVVIPPEGHVKKVPVS